MAGGAAGSFGDFTGLPASIPEANEAYVRGAAFPPFGRELPNPVLPGAGGLGMLTGVPP